MQVFNAIIIYILLPFNCVSGEKSKRMLNLLRSMCYPSVLDLHLGSVNVSLKYRKSSIRSRPSIILDTKFHRLVLEVIQKVESIEHRKISEVKEGHLRTPKMSKNMILMFSAVVAYNVRPLIT